MDQPLWLSQAWALIGEREQAGLKANPRIMALYRDAGHPEVGDDATAWCAAFAGACLERAGFDGTGSLMVRSYLVWGKPISDERTGAIAVLSRGANPAQGHVGFLIGATETHLVLLGGNQSDQVNVQAFPRSRLLGLRWPDAATSGPQQVAPPKADVNEGALFEAALSHVLEMEGGYSDDPHDPGGPTNFGITLCVYADWTRQTIEATSRDRLKGELRRIGSDMVRDIYRVRYWEPSGAAELPDALAFLHFDTAVNHGVGRAIRLLQEAVGVDVDGDIGPETEGAIRVADLTSVLGRIAELRRARYRALPHFWRFGRGWLRRVDTTLARARDLVSPDRQGPSIQRQQTGDSSMTAPAAIEPTVAAKWWGESMTVWGAIITAVATVLPALGPVVGWDITPEMVKLAGSQTYALVQAVAGLMGTLLTIYGRVRATQPLERRPVSLKL